MKDKRDWSETEFTEKIRIKKEDKEYVKKIKKKKSEAGMLSEIINFHKKYEKNS